MKSMFKTLNGRTYNYPLFFPDATNGEVRHLSNEDVIKTGTQGILVNTFHISRLKASEVKVKGGIKPVIGWDGPMISDSGGFQVMSIAKRYSGNSAITDDGVTFEMNGVKHHFTPEDSITFQLEMGTDLMVVLDDFTPPDATHEEAEITVLRTTEWAKRCKDTFERILGTTSSDHSSTIPQRSQRSELGAKRPYLIGVVQGGLYEDLRLRSIRELVAIGFDGYGFGGWPMRNGKFDTQTAMLIAENVPKESLLYGLGIGKPDDIVACVALGWQVFDCVLPTRDARHGRLYVYSAGTMDTIDVHAPHFYGYYNPRHADHLQEKGPVSTACDCELCTTLTRAEFATMWRGRDERVLRLATIHNLRFYAILMGQLRGETPKY